MFMSIAFEIVFESFDLEAFRPRAVKQAPKQGTAHNH
jgi:hypothetical protein